MVYNKIDFNVLPKKQIQIYKKLRELPWLEDFYLAGGTALTLQIGHRQSIDFDFFSIKDFNNRIVKDNLSLIGEFTILSEEENTIHGILEGVNLSFLGYKYPLLKDLMKDMHLKIAHLIDIACMKLSAIIIWRGNKKDFIDLYFILQKYPLEDLLDWYAKKYQSYNYEYVLLKAITYFDDAEKDPMPIMLKKTDWVDVKKRLIEEARKMI